MSRFGVALMACSMLLGLACRSSAPSNDAPYVATVDCDFEARGSSLTYGFFGDPSPVGYRCKAVEAPPPVEMPDGLRPDPAAPATIVEDGARP